MNRCPDCGKFMGEDHDCEASPVWKKIGGKCMRCSVGIRVERKVDLEPQCQNCGHVHYVADFEHRPIEVEYVRGKGKCKWREMEGCLITVQKKQLN